jgi:undecaprenyl-diphosphatase
LLIYFRDDWLRLIPAGLAAIRDRSFRDDPDRKLAWLLVAATLPAALVGALFSDIFETQVRQIGLVALTLVVGGAILWIADHVGARSKGMQDVSFPVAVGIGAAQAIALIPGISRSGISISAGRLAGLEREAAARFAFLMATPITGGAILFEARKLMTGEAGVTIDTGPLIAGLLASFVSGIIAIRVMLGYIRTRSLDVFVIYRFVLAAVVLIVWLGR